VGEIFGSALLQPARCVCVSSERFFHLERVSSDIFHSRLPFITRNSADTDEPRDAFVGQSGSPNMVPFDMLGMVSYYCAIVTLSLRYST